MILKKTIEFDQKYVIKELFFSEVCELNFAHLQVFEHF